jgi:hypothetical protein
LDSLGDYYETFLTGISLQAQSLTDSTSINDAFLSEFTRLTFWYGDTLLESQSFPFSIAVSCQIAELSGIFASDVALSTLFSDYYWCSVINEAPRIGEGFGALLQVSSDETVKVSKTFEDRIAMLMILLPIVGMLTLYLGSPFCPLRFVQAPETFLAQGKGRGRDLSAREQRWNRDMIVK